MVDQALHEHAASLPAAGHANRSGRLIKCAKDSGHHRGRPCACGKNSDARPFRSTAPKLAEQFAVRVVIEPLHRNPLPRCVRAGQILHFDG